MEKHSIHVENLSVYTESLSVQTENLSIKFFPHRCCFQFETTNFSNLTNYKKYWYPLKGWRPERPQAGGEVQSTEPLLSTQPTTEPRSGWQSYLLVYPSYLRHSVYSVTLSRGSATLHHLPVVCCPFRTCQSLHECKTSPLFFFTSIEWFLKYF